MNKRLYAICTGSGQSQFWSTQDRWVLAPNATIQTFTARAAAEAVIRAATPIPRTATQSMLMHRSPMVLPFKV